MTQAYFRGDYVSATSLGGGRIELCFDRKEGPVNTLDSALLAELGRLLDALEQDTALRGVLVSSAKDAFLAGADIKRFMALFEQPEPALIAFCANNIAVTTRLAQLPVPVVCAINGYALGGGLETALCSDVRILAANAQLGLPEVGLGVIPGLGGTARLPRLAGAAVALDWISSARPQKPQAALSAGVVDAIAEPAQLRETALQWLDQAMAGALDWQARRVQHEAPFALDEAALTAARAQAQKTARHYPAALAAVELLGRAAPLNLDAALQAESAVFASLAKTPTAKALAGIFLANQQLKKKSRQQGRREQPPRRAAVLGAGIMGGGIAYATAVKGMPVILKDIAQKALDLGTGEARKLLAKQVDGGRLQPEQSAAILASIVPQLAFDDFDTVDVVVEAVVENLKVKQDVLGQVEALVKPGTVLASNTSSLAIGDIAAALKRPEDVVGMHFFNPVPLMPLVEIIRGPQTRDDAISIAVCYALAMGKTPLVVKDCAGFLVNRLLGAYFAAFYHLLHEGADFVQVDRAMESWGWPMGPAYLLDVAGNDTLDKAMAILGQAYPSVMATDFESAVTRLAHAGRYGQKSGAGFYRYEADAKGRPRRSEDPATCELLKQVQPNGPRSFSDEEIVERMMLAMMLEADRCLHQEIVDSAIEIDAGMRLGTGFPAHHGGPLWYADRLGAGAVLRRAAAYAPLGGLYAAGQHLQALAASGGRYYRFD